MFAQPNRLKTVVAVAILCVATACTALYRNHGYVPNDDELAELVVGVDTRATVDDVIGAPSASGVLSGGDYYYVRSRFREYGMFKPEVIDRQVVAISFDDQDVIANIERFGLEDGMVVPLSRRVTSTSVRNKSFIRQLFGNIGGIALGDAIGN